MKKLTTCGVILSILLVAISPSILGQHIKTIPHLETKTVCSNKLVNVTVKIYSPYRVENIVKKLPQSFLKKIQQKISEIQSTDSLITVEKNVETIVEMLEDHDMLEKNVNKNMLKNLILGKTKQHRLINTFLSYIKKHYENEKNVLPINAGDSSEVNYLSIMAGVVENSKVHPILTEVTVDLLCRTGVMLIFILWVIGVAFSLDPGPIENFLLTILASLSLCGFLVISSLTLMLDIMVELYQRLPVTPPSINIITFGEYDINGDIKKSAYGKLSSIGLNGIKHWEGEFTGGIDISSLAEYFLWYTYGPVGAIGFTGLSITSQQTNTTFYLGTTPYISITSST